MPKNQENQAAEDGKPKKPSKSDVYVNIANALVSPKHAHALGLQVIPENRFIVVMTSDRKPLLATVDNEKNVTLSNYEHFAMEVGRCSLMSGITLLRSGIQEVYNLFLSLSESVPFDDIKTLATLECKGYAFNRVAVKPSEIDKVNCETPMFDELLSRVVGANEFMCFVGSLFDTSKEADRSQYLWLYGHGNNGKSTIIRVLSRLLGEAATTEIEPTKGREHFWTHRVIGRRLVAIPDCENTEFVKSGTFKALTGESEVSLERKGKDFFKAKLDCKFIFSSNDLPVLSASPADLRRAIVCEVKPWAAGVEVDTGYGDKIALETKGILAKCIKAYRDSGSKLIVLSGLAQEMQDRTVSESELLYWSFFDQHCALELNSNAKSSDLYGTWTAEKKDSKEYAKFMRWLQRKHGVKKSRVEGRIMLSGIKFLKPSF